MASFLFIHASDMQSLLHRQFFTCLAFVVFGGAPIQHITSSNAVMSESFRIPIIPCSIVGSNEYCITPRHIVKIWWADKMVNPR